MAHFKEVPGGVWMKLKHRMTKHVLSGALLAALIAPGASAAAMDPERQAMAKLMLLMLTGFIAAFIGFLLYNFSQRSSQAKVKGSQETKTTGAEGGARALAPALFEELSRLPVSPQQRQHVARSVSDIVAKAIDERVVSVRRELDARYEQLVEDKRRSESTLQRKYEDTLGEKKQTSAILESIAEGLVVVNNKGEVVMMNPAAEKLLSVNDSGRLGRPLLEGLQDTQLVSLVRGNADEDREIVLNAKQESTKRVLRASNAVITDENGKTVGMVAVLSDVTQQRQLEQMKSDFVSTVSHELRTPIVAMQHSLSILVDQVAGPLSEEQQKFLGITQRNLVRLNTLINDLLDLSKMEAKKMQLHLESGSVASVIQGVCDSLGAWTQSKEITIIRRVSDDLPRVTFDQARITQVITNLVGNAVKFTPKQGRVTIEAKRMSSGDGIEVSVTDTGVGIAKEHLPKLFGKFQQVGERSSTDISGTGLGLAIAKEIVELHHGRIWAESETRQGARFTFTVPLVQPSAPSGAG